MEQPDLLELAGPLERSHVDGLHTARLDERRDPLLGARVVPGDEHLQGLAGDLARDQGLGEGRVEGF